MTRAKVAAMIAEAVTEKEKEQVEQETLRKGLISDLKEMVDAQDAALMPSGGSPRKTLQRAGANVSATEASERVIDQDAVVDRCDESLMSKFNAMGTKSKAGKKAG